jgi:NAD(P)-dependent dehydrogenase (short-subunit alcohol dehydrogenase family)
VSAIDITQKNRGNCNWRYALRRASAVLADLSTSEGRATVVREIAAREPARHILVNNEGAAWGAPLAEYPESGVDKVMDLNVKAIFFLTRDLLPLLDAAARPGDPARVINIHRSTVSRSPRPRTTRTLPPTQWCTT